MDDTAISPNPTDPTQPLQTNEKETITATFTGADGSEGYKNGEVYTLQTWQENGMIFIAKEDGSGQVAYDSTGSLMQNWEVQPKQMKQPETPSAE